MIFDSYFNQQLQKLRDEGRYRYFANIERCAGDFPYAYLNTDGGMKKIIVWCGNDYLGMGQNQTVIDTMVESLKAHGAGAGGTRNISGTNTIHVELEKELAILHEKQAALIFSSGYVANEAALSTLGALLPNCVILSDSDNHASMIQGIRHSKAEKIIFKHNDLNDLRQKLASLPANTSKIIAFESVYSMGGDKAPIPQICDIAEEFEALTYLDEVHGVGMYGKTGAGLAEQMGVAHRVNLIQGTLGKAFGLVGGYITGSEALVDFIRSFAPGFIFTTSMAPAVAAGAVASIRHLKSSDKERTNQQSNVTYLKNALANTQIPFLDGGTHIVPVIVGDAAKCKALSDILLHDYGIYAQPINYPTVPKGTERIRLTPSALHTKEMINDLVNALQETWDTLMIDKAA